MKLDITYIKIVQDHDSSRSLIITNLEKMEKYKFVNIFINNYWLDNYI